MGLESPTCSRGTRRRTFKIAFEARYSEATEDSFIFPWMVRRAAWLVTRYGVKQDGRTAYQRLRGRTYKGKVAEFGEVVLYKISNQGLRKLEDRWACGVWLGKTLSKDEHLLQQPTASSDAGPSADRWKRSDS